MITEQDIELLTKRIAERKERFEKMIVENPNMSSGNELAALASTEGWSTIRAAFEQMIIALLVPDESAGMTAEAYQISGESRRLTILAIKSIVESVESAVAARAITKS